MQLARNKESKKEQIKISGRVWVGYQEKSYETSQGSLENETRFTEQRPTTISTN